MPFAFPDSLAPDFRVSLVERPDRWDVTCGGSLDRPEATRAVQEQLLRLHAAALEAGVRVIGLHVEAVEYMNSSGLKSFMTWFLAASNVRRGAYLIEVTYDPTRSWQELALRPMERLAPETVRLVGAPAGGPRVR